MRLRRSRRTVSQGKKQDYDEKSEWRVLEMKYGKYLSNDIARCSGKDGASVCYSCRRREPSDSDRQAYIIPQIRIDGFCENAINSLKEEAH